MMDTAEHLLVKEGVDGGANPVGGVEPGLNPGDGGAPSSDKNGRFVRDWATTVAVVGWKFAQPGDVALVCVAEELALFALIRQAQVLLELRESDSDGVA
jgi:hypothetical protein